MYNQNIFLLIGAIVIAGFLTFSIFKWAKSKDQPVIVENKGLPTTTVLVAVKSLPAGKKITMNDLRWQSWPKDAYSKSYVTQGTRKKEDFIGALVRWPIAKGQPIITNHIAYPEHRGYLATIIHPGMRAVSVDVDAASGVAGFIFPGDRVDVILTHKPGHSRSDYVSETILTDVSVLALDQTTIPQQGKQADIAKTVTLEVSPKQAEMLAVGKRVGKLTLSLQGFGLIKGDKAANTAFTRATKISRVVPDNLRAVNVVPVVTVIRGNVATKIKME